MNILRSPLMATAIIALGRLAIGCDLELDLRAHSEILVFGDPLYVEVTLRDRSDDPFASPVFLVPQPQAWSRRLSLVFSFPRGGNFEFCETHRLAAADWDGPVVVEPGRSIRYYCRLMVPPFPRWSDAFWREAGVVFLTTVYQVSGSRDSAAVITSAPWGVSIERRQEAELAALALWHARKSGGEVPRPGPTPADFGLPLYAVDLNDLTQFVHRTKLSGELREVVGVSLRLRELFESPSNARDERNARLLDCLRTEPDFVTHLGAPPWVVAAVHPHDIEQLRAQQGRDGLFSFLARDGGIKRFRYDLALKRRVLAGQLRAIALRYKMATTAEALEGLMRDLEPNTAQTGETGRRRGACVAADRPSGVTEPSRVE